MEPAAAARRSRDLHPAPHDASAVLVALEEEHAARICIAEPARAQEADRETRAEAAREMRNGMRVRRGGLHAIGMARTRVGRRLSGGAPSARSYGQGRTCWGAWIVLGCRSLTGCYASTRRAEQRLRTLVMRRAVCVQGHLRMKQRLRSALQRPHPLSFEERDIPPRRHHRLLLHLNYDNEDDDAPGAIPSDLSPASRRRSTTSSTCGASGPKGVAASRCSTLRGSSAARKASATSKCRRPLGDTGERRARGDTRPAV